MDETSARLDRLIARWRAGEAAAYHAFLAEAARLLRAFMLRRLGDRSQAEDLVQECLMAIHAKRATLDPGRPVGPWMFAIARYKLADYWRRRRREGGAAREHLEQADERADPRSIASRLDVAALLARLPDGQAEAIRLTQIEGMTGREASRRAGIGLSALKLRVHRGMARLKAMAAKGE